MSCWLTIFRFKSLMFPLLSQLSLLYFASFSRTTTYSRSISVNAFTDHFCRHCFVLQVVPKRIRATLTLLLKQKHHDSRFVLTLLNFLNYALRCQVDLSNYLLYLMLFADSRVGCSSRLTQQFLGRFLKKINLNSHWVVFI